ncbi:PIG-L family deacetylase [Mariniluteicoccus endophyticus]
MNMSEADRPLGTEVDRPLGSNADRLGVVAETADRGTPAESWAPYLSARPALDLDLLVPPACSRVLVVAPHPDDEVLGVGALAARLVSRVEVVVLAVTDGTAAYPSLDPGELAATRIRESEAACAVLGIPEPLRLRLPDGDVGVHEDTLVACLADVLTPTTLCLATWRGDGHPDHEATGRAAARACADMGVPLAEYPVWAWHWARPDDDSLPLDRAAAIALTPDEVARKSEAVRCYTSQISSPAEGIEPVLPSFVLERLVTDREVLFL